MKHAVLKSLAAAGTLALAIAAWLELGAHRPAPATPPAARPWSSRAPRSRPHDRHFNPYVQSSTGYSAQATGAVSTSRSTSST